MILLTYRKMWCNKEGSKLIKIDKSYACTLPKKAKMCCIVFIICLLILCTFLYIKEEKHFIPSTNFVGAKKGYVFKMKNGKLGYHKDHFI